MKDARQPATVEARLLWCEELLAHTVKRVYLLEAEGGERCTSTIILGRIFTCIQEAGHLGRHTSDLHEDNQEGEISWRYAG